MIRLRFFLLTFAAVLCSPVLLVLINTAAYGLTVDRVLATLNNEVVTLSDYKKYITKTGQTADRENVSELYLKRLLEERLILQEAKKAGIDATEDEVSAGLEAFMKQTGIVRQDMEKKLADEGISMAEYLQLLRDNIISLKIIDKEVNAKVIVTTTDIRQFYENNMKLFQESSEKVLIKAIYLKLSDNASVTEITDLKIKSLKIYDEIKKGSPFDMLAMNYKEIQGEFERGMMIPALDNRIFTLKEGEVSEPVWTREGAYILKAVKISKPSYKPIDAVREEIHEKIYEQKREEKFNEWMKWLWEKSSIHIRQ
jgi:peptidyl-prolyl cis-trans isomerase SurA